jgi:hypothetical protein
MWLREQRTTSSGRNLTEEHLSRTRYYCKIRVLFLTADRHGCE